MHIVLLSSRSEGEVPPPGPGEHTGGCVMLVVCVAQSLETESSLEHACNFTSFGNK